MPDCDVIVGVTRQANKRQEKRRARCRGDDGDDTLVRKVRFPCLDFDGVHGGNCAGSE